MPISVNCTSFRGPNRCIHQAAPRQLFGKTVCIVWLQSAKPPTDPRAMPGCALCTPYPHGGARDFPGHVPPHPMPAPAEAKPSHVSET